ncbi:MAG: helix-turn-helix transcriptional regulator [Candidatus Magasanikbacteria bacterium]|nr:helix-turn-helix transcriptional regulator [Candidatus Magasanikbacteria bacterium]
MKSYLQFKKQLLKDKEIRRNYEKLDTEFALAKAIIEMRNKRGLTQAVLAKKIGTKQSSVARLESGNYNPSIAFLGKVALALDARLKVSLL